jgi:hypothetical protein
MTTPFTYLIGWPEHDLFYYGVKYSKGCEPSDLWTRYFTSSKHVLKARQNIGEPSIVEVRQVFEDASTARGWETRVLQRLDARNNPKFLNKTNVPAPGAYEFTREHRDFISKRLTGRVQSSEERTKRIASLTGKKKTPEHIAAVVAAKAARRAERVAAGTQHQPPSGWKMNEASVSASVQTKKARRLERIAAGLLKPGMTREERSKRQVELRRSKRLRVT